MNFSLAAVTRAREAFEDYTVWAYSHLHKHYTLAESIRVEWNIAKDHELDTEAKAYFSVLVNEFNRSPVSRYGVGGEDDGR